MVFLPSLWHDLRQMVDGAATSSFVGYKVCAVSKLWLLKSAHNRARGMRGAVRMTTFRGSAPADDCKKYIEGGRISA